MMLQEFKRPYNDWEILGGWLLGLNGNEVTRDVDRVTPIFGFMVIDPKVTYMTEDDIGGRLAILCITDGNRWSPTTGSCMSPTVEIIEQMAKRHGVRIADIFVDEAIQFIFSKPVYITNSNIEHSTPDYDKVRELIRKSIHKFGV